MTRMRKHISVGGLLVSGLLIMNAVILYAALTENKKYYGTLAVSLILLVIAMWDLLGRKHTDNSY